MMKSHRILTLAAGTALIALAGPALAETTTTTTTVTTKENVIQPDGAVTYQSHTVVTENPPVVRPVTFYYYDLDHSRIRAASDLTETVFAVWDTDRNGMIDMNEYYNNMLVVYEPVEFSSRTYQDVDADGYLELTKQEYTFRLQKLPGYTVINTDGKEGMSVYEFVGAGFQVTDDNDDNMISYAELREAFYGQPRLAKENEIYNQ